jgi:outer membrane protein with beta-barrel domain
MRRRFTFVGIPLVALLYATTASAQVGGGIKVGLNFATISGFNDPGDSTSQRTGLVAGGFLTFGFAPMIAFQPEVLFSMQGTKFRFTDSGVDTDASAKIDYIQVPLLLRIGSSGKGAAGLYGLVGPTFGKLQSAKQSVAGEPEVDFKDELKSTDMGLVVGVGFTLSRLLLEGRYTHGLTDLNKTTDSGSTNKNRVLSVLVGLQF